jgi:hypothetical protein
MRFISDYLSPEDDKKAEEAMNRSVVNLKKCSHCQKNVEEPCTEKESKTCSNMEN